jgi:hypothetical protein
MTETDIHGHLEDKTIWNEKIAREYDTPGQGMFADAVVQPAVRFLEQLAGSGKVLELAVGTGRIAIPLANRGIRVSGIDYSAAMVEQLHRKIDADILPVTIGDMTTTKVEGRFSLVYLVYNGISNLLTQEAQVQCFKNAAAHLDSGGRFVIELWIPELRKLPPGQQAVVWAVEKDYIGLDTYDLQKQHVISHHIRINRNGEKVELYRSQHRFIWPGELDLMAKLAGFRLENRFSDWDRSPFDAEKRSHISIYMKE